MKCLYTFLYLKWHIILLWVGPYLVNNYIKKLQNYAKKSYAIMILLENH